MLGSSSSQLLGSTLLAAATALPTEGEEVHETRGAVYSFVSVLLADSSTSRTDGSESGSVVASRFHHVAHATVVLATSAFESIPAYWLAILMVAAVVGVFLLCWGIMYCLCLANTERSALRAAKRRRHKPA